MLLWSPIAPEECSGNHFKTPKTITDNTRPCGDEQRLSVIHLPLTLGICNVGLARGVDASSVW